MIEVTQEDRDAFIVENKRRAQDVPINGQVAKRGLRLDLGCGRRRKPGFVGVDIAPDSEAEVVRDLREMPWPWADGSVEEAWSSHFVEHLGGLDRILFFDELWRVMADGAKATIITPYHASQRAIMDPTHAWPPIGEDSYLYFSRRWRQDQRIGHYAIKANFSFTYQFIRNPHVEFPDEVSRGQGERYYWNVVDDLMVTLTKEP